MPYEAHSEIQTPTRAAMIWRYLDFTKFVSLLSTQSLFFCNLTKFADPHEGLFPALHHEQFASGSPDPKRLAAVKREVEISSRPRFFLNCWHQNDYESAAMWKLYLQSNEGVAVQSRCGRLIDALNRDTTGNRIYIASVDYQDYRSPNFKEGYVFSPVVYKRMSFQHEREVRAFYWTPPNQPTTSHGEYITIDVDMLIEGVYVAPASPDWFLKVVESVMQKYGFTGKQVIRSDIDKSPT